MFELKETVATFSTMTPRVERHGDELVPSVSLGLKIAAANTILDKLRPGLTGTLYKPLEGEPDQHEIEGTEITHLPTLRSSAIETFTIKGVAVGWTMVVDYGISQSSAVTLEGCKLDKFWCKPHEGGSVELHMRVGTSLIDEAAMGKLSMMLGSEITISLIAPKQQGDAALKQSDGDGPDYSNVDATDAFVASAA